jgi:hypothetical protein
VSRIVWGIFGTHAMFCIIGYVMKQTETDITEAVSWLLNDEAMLSILPEGKLWIGIFNLVFICDLIHYGVQFTFKVTV